MSRSLVSSISLVGLLAAMGNGQSSPLADCLDAVCGDRSDCVNYAGAPFYQSSWVKPYNLDVPVTPAAVIRPDDADDVAAAVKCAVEHKVKVQAKSGGHSYAYVESPPLQGRT